MDNGPQPSRESLRLSTKLAYGAGDLGPAMTANVLVFFLLYFFTNVAGLSAGLAGMVLAIGKISDAINDPITGMLSDRTRSRWGRRIPWMLGGIIPFGLLFFVQWLVPRFSGNPTTNEWLLFVYYVLIGILFNLAFTAVNLPYTALTPELTQDYNERTSLNSFRMAFSIGGSILSLVLAQLIFALYPEEPQRQYLALGELCAWVSIAATLWCCCRIQERHRQPLLPYALRHNGGYILAGLGGLAAIVGLAAVGQGAITLMILRLLLLGLLSTAAGITLIFSQAESHLVAQHDPAQAVPRPANAAQPPANPSPSNQPLGFGAQIKIAFATRPFLYVIGIYLCSWLAVQLTASILIYYVVSWIGLSESAFPQVAIAVQGTALVMLFVWQRLSDRWGKKQVYALGTAIWIGAAIAIFWLQPGQIWQTYALSVLIGLGVSVAYLIPWSMVPDVIELDELQTGQRREGIFYGFMVLLQKVGLALALFLVGQSLELAGFIRQLPGEPIQAQPETALLAIRIVMSAFPAIVLVGGLVLAYFYPITRVYHEEIRAQLAARKAAAGELQS
ncbi:MAG: MFS transporter [Cyanobacteria bacterium P01_G01_bin.54]